MITAARRAFSNRSNYNSIIEDENSPSVILRKRHSHVQRQMRLLLVYPILYFCIWLCPFIYHCLQYNDQFIQHQPIALVISAFVSLTIGGAVNSLAFCLREKPWTLIPECDGTFMGSFTTWPRTVTARQASIAEWSGAVKY